MTSALPFEEISEVLRSIVHMADEHRAEKYKRASHFTVLKLKKDPLLGPPSSDEVALRRRMVYGTVAMAAAKKSKLACIEAGAEDDSTCPLIVTQSYHHPHLTYPCPRNEILDCYIDGVRQLLEASIEDQQAFARQVEKEFTTNYSYHEEGAERRSGTKRYRKMVSDPDFGISER